ncbi:MAG: 2-oxo acid dehydrogenase subunit E2 [Chloroflexia bacterium]|nr:2-oxo acid dehydrogenase subunit E2 [Chloroflexia bacterium]
MATVIMPKMGDAMEEGTLLKWLKSAGEEVAEGDPIAEIETDKVTLEIEAPEAGFLTNTLVEEGAVVPIGTAVATIGAESEVGAPAETTGGEEKAAEIDVADVADQVDEAAVVAQVETTPEPKNADEPAPADAPAETPASAGSPVIAASAEADSAPSTAGVASATQVVDRQPGERIRASPLVKRLAEEHAIDLSQVTGTGPGGRIVKNDINDFVTGAKPAPKVGAPAEQAAPPAAPPSPASANGQVAAASAAEAAPPAIAPQAVTPPAKGTKVDLARIRRTTGKRMTESKQSIPHYYVTTSVDMTAAMAFRTEINASLAATGGKVSVNDLIVKAAALALVEHPAVNTSFENGDLYQHDEIDINIAIAMDGGLIAPFVPGADQKSLGSIARITKDLGRRAREGGLQPEDYQGGTFTISNLGMFEVDEFIAVINPPQAAILAIGSVQEVPVVSGGEIVVGQVMKITLSADHRALDGAQVARFVGSVKSLLENPMLLAIS